MKSDKKNLFDKVMEFWPIILLLGAGVLSWIKLSYSIQDTVEMTRENDRRIDMLDRRLIHLEDYNEYLSKDKTSLHS